MTKLELAKKNGVSIGIFYRADFSKNWFADIDNTKKELKRCKKLSILIKFLAKNNIKINN